MENDDLNADLIPLGLLICLVLTLVVYIVTLVCAQNMKLIRYEEVEDCKYPSTNEEVIKPDTGEKVYIITQDSRCE